MSHLMTLPARHMSRRMGSGIRRRVAGRGAGRRRRRKLYQAELDRPGRRQCIVARKPMDEAADKPRPANERERERQRLARTPRVHHADQACNANAHAGPQ
jgi:hypothetical protein